MSLGSCYNLAPLKPRRYKNGDSTRDSWWTNQHWSKVFSEFLWFPLLLAIPPPAMQHIDPCSLRWGLHYSDAPTCSLQNKEVKFFKLR